MGKREYDDCPMDSRLEIEIMLKQFRDWLTCERDTAKANACKDREDLISFAHSCRYRTIVTAIEAFDNVLNGGYKRLRYSVPSPYDTKNLRSSDLGTKQTAE